MLRKFATVLFLFLAPTIGHSEPSNLERKVMELTSDMTDAEKKALHMMVMFHVQKDIKLLMKHPDNAGSRWPFKVAAWEYYALAMIADKTYPEVKSVNEDFAEVFAKMVRGNLTIDAGFAQLNELQDDLRNIYDADARRFEVAEENSTPEREADLLARVEEIKSILIGQAKHVATESETGSVP